MTKLPKYTLTHNEKKERWDLVNDTTNRTKASFDTKGDATKGGVLEKAVGPGGGSVRIQKENGGSRKSAPIPAAGTRKNRRVKILGFDRRALAAPGLRCPHKWRALPLPASRIKSRLAHD